MSSRNYKISSKGKVAPKPKYPALVKNLSKIVELCGGNESEAARKLGFEPAHFYQWLHGEHAPNKGYQQVIAAKLGISVDELMHGEGAVKEDTAHYGPKLSRSEQRALDIFDELMKSGDKEITGHLERQINLLYDLYQTRQRRERKED